jgi:Ser/Thr protein kinase RdoA (MazF antagonist)
MLEPFGERSAEVQIQQLTEFATQILSEYPVAIAGVEMINHGYNSTLAVTTNDQQRFALRINVNSPRSAENLRAELAWIDALSRESDLSLPRPIATSTGDLFTTRFSHQLNRTTSAVLFSWLPGTEVDALEDQDDAISAMGRALATLHHHGRSFTLPDHAALPLFDEFFFGFENHLFGPLGRLEQHDAELFLEATGKIADVLARLTHDAKPQILHGDVHPGNVMWHNGMVSIFDFDDCGIGLPVQDLGISLYYLESDHQRELLLDGYAQVGELPSVEAGDFEALMVQRRLQLLNYMLESQNPEHQGLLEGYLPTTRDRVLTFLNHSTAN